MAQLALVTLLAKLLSVDDFAIYVLVVATVAIGEVASDFGTRILATKAFAVQQDIGAELPRALSAKLLFSAVLGLLLMVFPFNLLGAWERLLCFLIAVTQPSTDPILWYLNGRERQDVEARVNVAGRLISVVLMALTAFTGAPVQVMLLGWLAANCLRIVVEVKLSETKPLVGYWSVRLGAATLACMRGAMPIGAAFLLIAFYHRLAIFVIEAQGSSHQVAAYGLAFSLVAATGFLGVSITTSSFPGLAKAIAAGDPIATSHVLRRELRLLTAVYAPMCLIGALASPWVIEMVYGEKLSLAGQLMVILFPGMYISVLNFSLKYAMNAVGMNWMDTVSVIVAVTVTLAVAVWTSRSAVIPIERGVAAAWGGGEAASFLIKWYCLVRSPAFSRVRLGGHFLLLLALTAVACLALTWGT